MTGGKQRGLRIALLGPLLGLCLLASACGQKPDPARPALWLVEGQHGEKGWLFGTIHALERPASWRSAAIDRAMAESDRVVVEIAGLADNKAMAAEFARLSYTPGMPPLSERIAPDLRDELAALLKRERLDEARFADVETWAAALTLARAGGGSVDAANGIDKAVMAATRGKPVEELEGARGQLGVFDALPEAEQRDLLSSIVREDGREKTESGSLAEAWRKGDMEPIERETHRGMLADPELRAALFTGRNRAWTMRIADLLGAGRKPFVAVGAAHMVGLDGLPALLAARGYKVTRVQ